VKSTVGGREQNEEGEKMRDDRQRIGEKGVFKG